MVTFVCEYECFFLYNLYDWLCLCLCQGYIRLGLFGLVVVVMARICILYL
jgi:hypothetical protein